jgi:fluoride ion exporter CrcB/FEX
VSPLAVSLVALFVILGGAFVGTLLRKALPDHHLADDAQDIIRLGAGLIGTIAALVLGLLIASAKSSYDTQSSQVQHLTADVVLLDQLLAQYGRS